MKLQLTPTGSSKFKLLNNLKIHKAPGPDGLSARVLKECSSEIAPILALIYNERLAKGTVPDDWRQANVAPIFKNENIRSSVRLFADDCVLYRNIETPTDCQILQDDLNSLAQWEADRQMKFNVAKCHSMRVTQHPPDKHIQFDYTLHQQRLEQVQSAKYLGITISDDLDWGQHISEISSKATKTLGFLLRNLAFAPRHTKEVAYKTLVHPKLEYAAPIWHPYIVP